MKSKLNTIPEAIADIKKGKLVIVVDDEDRENEGDFIGAARHVTPEMINFMSKAGRGLICTPISQAIAERLHLDFMVGTNSSNHETAFTVSIDLKGHGCTTGISAHDRSKTIRAMIDPKVRNEEFARPGHIFPLIAKEGGVLRRTGHTEATVDLARLAGLEEAGVLVEIMNEDGSMARLPDLLKLAKKYKMKIISIKDLIAYRMKNERLIRREEVIKMPTKYGDFKLVAYAQLNNNDVHMALVKGTWKEGEPVLVRVHSSCATGDILGSLRCDCGDQLHAAMRTVEKAGKGVILYIQQEGRGIGLLNKLHAYRLQEKGKDTVDANLALGFNMDNRDYGVGAQILNDLGVKKMKLMTNNPKKRVGLIGYGLEIVENVPMEVAPNPHNLFYLQTKRDKMGHEILKETAKRKKATPSKAKKA
ncbi:MAG: bifunctional 3,4-dihydroxy-2-butanone-4-phosphate synthase/GTP cyclohydrolase II [Chitinophagales bacterium]